MGFDGRPLRRVLKPKDPTKPWTVSGWSRVKEINAIGRLKKMAFWKEHEATFLEEGQGDAMAAEWPKSVMEQVRASGGSILDQLEAMDVKEAAEKKKQIEKEMAHVPTPQERLISDTMEARKEAKKKKDAAEAAAKKKKAGGREKTAGGGA